MPSLFAWVVPMAPLFGCIVCAVLSFRGDRKIAHFPAILSLLFAAVSSLCLVFFGGQGEAGTTTYEGYRRHTLPHIALRSHVYLSDDRNLFERLHA